jgi:D-serine deaminase-like pyridoxal phosphate-dependent protein
VNFPGLHFGVWRSPLRSAEEVRPVLERIKRTKRVKLDGVMGYEAQIAGVGDQVPGQAPKNALVQQLKKRSLGIIAQRRREVVDLIKSSGFELRFVNGGGTGSELTTRAEPVVTEITVGSGFYSPALFDHYKAFRYQPAAGYAIEIVRKPAPGIYTCLGGGYVASGAAGPDKLPQPYLPEGAKLIPLEGAGEVQTPVVYQGMYRLDPGDPIFMRHAKAGELCERFTHLVLIKQGQVVDEVATYRGDGQCFL